MSAKRGRRPNASMNSSTPGQGPPPEGTARSASATPSGVGTSTEETFTMPRIVVTVWARWTVRHFRPAQDAWEGRPRAFKNLEESTVRRSSLVLSSLLVGGLLLAGCGNADTSGSGNAKQAGGGTV